MLHVCSRQSRVREGHAALQVTHCDGTGVKGCPTSTLQVCSRLCGPTGMCSSSDAPCTLTFHEASYGCRTSCHTMACTQHALAKQQMTLALARTDRHTSTQVHGTARMLREAVLPGGT